MSGVGPKLALALLNGLTPVMFRGLVVAGDIAALSRVKGVGKKTAERIIVEVARQGGRERGVGGGFGDTGAWRRGEQHLNDAVLALISLGYKQAEAHKAVRSVRDAQAESHGRGAGEGRAEVDLNCGLGAVASKSVVPRNPSPIGSR